MQELTVRELLMATPRSIGPLNVISSQEVVTWLTSPKLAWLSRTNTERLLFRWQPTKMSQISSSSSKVYKPNNTLSPLPALQQQAHSIASIHYCAIIPLTLLLVKRKTTLRSGCHLGQFQSCLSLGQSHTGSRQYYQHYPWIDLHVCRC